MSFGGGMRSSNPFSQNFISQFQQQFPQTQPAISGDFRSMMTPDIQDFFMKMFGGMQFGQNRPYQMNKQQVDHAVSKVEGQFAEHGMQVPEANYQKLREYYQKQFPSVSARSGPAF